MLVTCLPFDLSTEAWKCCCEPSQQNEARLLRDEVHRLTAELNGRRQALEKLQRKHQTLVMKGRGQDGECCVAERWLGGSAV